MGGFNTGKNQDYLTPKPRPVTSMSLNPGTLLQGLNFNSIKISDLVHSLKGSALIRNKFFFFFHSDILTSYC